MTSTYFDVIVERMSEVRKGHLITRKINRKDTNIFNTLGFCIRGKTMVKYVIYLLFSYQTGYIM